MAEVRRRKSPDAPTSANEILAADADRLPMHRGKSLRRSSSFSRFGFASLAIFNVILLCLWIMSTQQTRQTTSVEPPIIRADAFQVDENDDADKLDFSGGHDVDKAYRLGDVFVVWYLMWQSFDELLDDYATAYPNMLAHEYLLEVGDEDYAHRNITALLRVMDRKEETMHFRRAGEDELVVHLRLGDVLTDPEYADLDISMEELWNQDEGFVNFDANVKSNYNKAEFKGLVERIPEVEAKKIKKCVIVGAGFITKRGHGNRNVEYKELVNLFLEESLGCEVSYHKSKNPDKDFLYMASAHWLIVAMGGFAQMAAACVTVRRGWGHAIYDKFNGEVAGWNDKRFNEKEKAIFRREYVDWSQVDLQATKIN